MVSHGQPGVEALEGLLLDVLCAHVKLEVGEWRIYLGTAERRDR